MAATITFNPTLNGIGAYNAGAAITSRSDQMNLGLNSFGVTLPQLAYGTGTTYASNAIMVNDWFSTSLTILTTVTRSIDFNGGADANPFGVPLVWTKLKLLIVSIQNPDGINYVKVGPNAVSEAAALWFGAATANIYESVYFTQVWVAPAAGWTVTASTAHLLPIENPGASTVTVAVFAAGVI